jgi:outer membrane protein, adhesin transport system
MLESKKMETKAGDRAVKARSITYSLACRSPRLSMPIHSLKVFSKLLGFRAAGYVASGVILAACASGPEQPPVVESELVIKSADGESPRPEMEAVTEKYGSYLYSDSHPPIVENAGMELGELTTSMDGKKQEGGGPSLGLDEALSSVWREHPNVQRAESEIEATGYDLQGAKTGYYPYLSLTAVEASNDASETSLNIIQPIWSGGRVSAEVRQAEAERNRALAQLNQIRLNLALETVDSYLGVVLAEEQGKLWRRYIASLDDLLRVIKNRAANGVSPQVDIQTAQTRLSLAKAGLASNNALLASSRSHLEALLHHRIPALYWPESRYNLTDSDIVRILEEQSVESHPAGQLAIAEIAAQKAAVDLAKASIFPTLSLQYSKALQQSDGDFTPDSSTRLVLQYTSSEGLRGLSGYKAVNQRLNAARQDLQYARRDVRDSILSAKAERDIALLQYDAQVDAARAAVKLVGSFLRQFKVGRKAWIEVLNAHREAHEALLQISNTKRSYWSANIRLALQGMLWVRVNNDAPSTYLDIEQE